LRAGRRHNRLRQPARRPGADCRKDGGGVSGRGHILIIDDDADLLAAASDWLEVSGFAVTAVSDPRTALERIARADPDVVVSDIRMPGLDGMTLLPQVLALNPGLPVVMMTGPGDIQLAV